MTLKTTPAIWNPYKTVFVVKAYFYAGYYNSAQPVDGRQRSISCIHELFSRRRAAESSHVISTIVRSEVIWTPPQHRRSLVRLYTGYAVAEEHVSLTADEAGKTTNSARIGRKLREKSIYTVADLLTDSRDDEDDEDDEDVLKLIKDEWNSATQRRGHWHESRRCQYIIYSSSLMRDCRIY